jgi:lipopolysaccharide heptosyltransferase I
VNPERILLVRLSAVGDVVHVLPALALLRRSLPEAHIAWIAESLSASLLEGHPMIDELIVYPRAHWRRQGYLRSLRRDIPAFFGWMRRRGFDVAVDFQGLTKSALIPRLSRIPRRIGYGGEDGREISPWLYTDRLAPPDEIEHVVLRNLYLLTALGFEAPSPLEFPLPDFSPERERIDSRLEETGIDRGEPLILLNPGAGWETKRWPPDYFGRLADAVARETGYRVVFTWGPGEEHLITSALDEVGTDTAPRVHRAPPTDLRELVALIDRAAVMVGGDTGPVHLAAARGVPVVCLYGGSDPKRNGPIGPGEVRVLDNPQVPCYPCWKVKCDNPPPVCLTTIDPDAVFEAVYSMLGQIAEVDEDEESRT